MKKVKYIPAAHLTYVYTDLTVNNIYDVIGYIDDNIKLLNDKGVVDYFYLYSGGGILEFIDVTHKYRNKVIDRILK